MNQPLVKNIFKQSTGSQDPKTPVCHRRSMLSCFLVLAFLIAAAPLARSATQRARSFFGLTHLYRVVPGGSPVSIKMKLSGYGPRGGIVVIPKRTLKMTGKAIPAGPHSAHDEKQIGPIHAVTDQDGIAEFNFTMPHRINRKSTYVKLEVDFAGDAEFLPSQNSEAIILTVKGN